MTRRALLLAGLVLLLFVPAAATAAPSEFFGMVQTATLDNQDIDEMAAARVRTSRFLLKWGWVQPTKGSSYQWDPLDAFVGRLAIQGIRSVPAVWGNPAWFGGLRLDSPDRWAGGRGLRGGTSSGRWWRGTARAAPTGHRPYHQRYGANAKPLADPGLADLERAQPAEVLRAQPVARQVRPAAPDLPRRDQEQGSGGPDRARRDVRSTGTSTPGSSSTPSTGARDQELVRRRRPAPVRDQPRPANAGDPEVPLGDDEPRATRPRRCGSPSSPGARPPPDGFGINKGLAGQAQMLNRAYKMILRTAPPGTSSASSGTTGAIRSTSARSCSFCGSAGLLTYDRTTKPAYARSGASRPRRPGPRPTHHRGADATGASSRTRPRASPSPPTSPARPSSAGRRRHLKRLQLARTRLPPLADGNHAFFVRAIDAPGNESPFVWPLLHRRHGRPAGTPRSPTPTPTRPPTTTRPS